MVRISAFEAEGAGSRPERASITQILRRIRVPRYSGLMQKITVSETEFANLLRGQPIQVQKKMKSPVLVDDANPLSGSIMALYVHVAEDKTSPHKLHFVSYRIPVPKL